MEQAATARMVAERVRRLRNQHGWTAQRLADECARAGSTSLTRGTIAKIESGVRKSVSAEEIAVLARVLGVTPTALLAGEPDPPRSPIIPGAADPLWHSPPYSLRPVVEALTDLPPLGELDTRRLCIELLQRRFGPGFRVTEYAATEQHLYAIAIACEEYQGGLQALVDVLTELIGDQVDLSRLRAAVGELSVLELVPSDARQKLSELLEAGAWPALNRIYRVAAGPYAPPPSPHASPAELFETLEDVNAKAGGLPPALIFVERLAAEADPELAARLRQWNREQAERMNVVDLLSVAAMEALEAPRSTEEPGVPAYLVFRIEFDALDEDRYLMGHWRQFGTGWQPEPGEQFTGTMPDVQQHIAELIADAESGWAADAESIGLEFVLPRKLLELPVDQWWRDPSEHPTQPLGIRYQVVVRSLERMRTRSWHRDWRRRWQVLQNHATSGLTANSTLRVTAGEPGGDRKLDAALARNTEVASLVLMPPRSHTPHDHPDEITVALRAGLPAVLWQRGDGAPANLDESLDEVFAWRRDLREGVRLLRTEAFGADDPATHAGSSLALLWDDPNRLIEPSRPPRAPQKVRN